MIKLSNNRNFYSSCKFEKGQTLLLILLSMAVVLTIVLSIMARSISDISVSSREEEATRAFSAAEAGIEKALIAGGNIALSALGNANFSANVSAYGEGAKNFSSPIGLISGESMLLWFVSHNSEGKLVCSSENKCFKGTKLKICWGKEETPSSSPTTPALEASIFYATIPGDYSTLRIAREVVDPNSERRSSNFFSVPDGGICQIEGEIYQFQKTIDFSALNIPAAVYGIGNGLQFMKIKIFYNTDVTHKVAVDTDFSGNSLLPAQGTRIESLGSAGEANRKIDVFQGFGELPAIFEAAVFSPGGIFK